MEVEYMTEDESNRVKSYIVGAGYNITSLAKAINNYPKITNFSAKKFKNYKLIMIY